MSVYTTTCILNLKRNPKRDKRQSKNELTMPMPSS